jgi:hypothetical protein
MTGVAVFFIFQNCPLKAEKPEWKTRFMNIPNKKYIYNKDSPKFQTNKLTPTRWTCMRRKLTGIKWPYRFSQKHSGLLHSFVFRLVQGFCGRYEQGEFFKLTSQALFQNRVPN